MSAKLIAAKCPNCAASLHVKPSQEAIRCDYCGGDVLLRSADPQVTEDGRTGGSDALQRAQLLLLAGKYKQAHAAFSRLLSTDARDGRAWLGLGISTARLGTVPRPRLDEALAAFRKAYSLPPDGDSDGWSSRVAWAQTEAASWSFDLVREYFDEFVESQPSFELAVEEYVKRMRRVLGVLEDALLNAPEDADILRALIRLCILYAEDLYYSGPDRHSSHDDVRVNVPQGLKQELEFKYVEYAAKLKELGARLPMEPKKTLRRVVSDQDFQRDVGQTVLHGLMAFFGVGALAALVVLVFTEGGPGGTAINGEGIVAVRGDSVPLFASPSVNAAVLNELTAGTPLQVRALNDTWLEVQMSDGKGYVRMEDIRPGQVGETWQDPTTWVTFALAGFFLAFVVRISLYARKGRRK